MLETGYFPIAFMNNLNSSCAAFGLYSADERHPLHFKPTRSALPPLVTRKCNHHAQISVKILQLRNSGEMFQWWTPSINGAERYIMWCPEEHVDFAWEIPPTKESPFGSIHIAAEKLGDYPASGLRIRLEDQKIAR